MKVAGSVGVVTGGASGLGLSVVEMLVQHQGHAVILDLPQSKGPEVARELGEQVSFIPVDITNPDDVERAAQRIEDLHERVDLLVNAAGISPGHLLVTRKGDLFPLDLFKKTIDVNLVGLIDVTRHVARIMSKNEPSEIGERGLIVNVSSIAAFEGQRGQAAYTASKGAVALLTIQLARDLAEFGIRVMAIAPGIMNTPMVSELDEKRRAPLMDLHLFPKRLGEPAEFATLVRTFMEVELLNGEVVRLDAGTRMA